MATVDVDGQTTADCVKRRKNTKAFDTFRAGTMTELGTGIDLDLQTDGRGLPVRLPWVTNDAITQGLTLEVALFAALFPSGSGGFSSGSFAAYLRYRLLCHFSPFTLYKPYLMICHLIRQCDQLHRSCKESVLEKDLTRYRKLHPHCTDEAAFRNAMKHIIPSSMPGSPGWHYQNLQDLFAMTEKNGLPDVFWTVTADEVSHLKWASIRDLEVLVKKFCKSYTWQVR